MSRRAVPLTVVLGMPSAKVPDASARPGDAWFIVSPQAAGLERADGGRTGSANALTATGPAPRTRPVPA